MLAKENAAAEDDDGSRDETVMLRMMSLTE